jgi:hypothetical protein
MQRTHRETHEAKTPQDFPHTAFVIFDIEFPLDNLQQVNTPPADERAIGGWPLLDDSGELFFLLWCQSPLSVPFRCVVHTFNPFGIVPDDPIAQGLPRHTRLASCVFTAHAIQHVGDRQQTRRRLTVLLATRLLPQNRGGYIAADFDPCLPHRFPLSLIGEPCESCGP